MSFPINPEIPIMLNEDVIGKASEENDGVPGLDADGNLFRYAEDGLTKILIETGGGVADVTTLTENTLYVSAASGDNNTGARGTLNAFATVGAARSAALAGDTIVVNPGSYVENNIYKENITYYLSSGVTITAEDLIAEALVQSPNTGTAANFTILGEGVLINNNPSGGVGVIRDTLRIRRDDVWNITCKSLTSASARTVAGDAGVINLNCETIDSSDGAIDCTGEESTINVNANTIIAVDHLLENDGGVINANFNKGIVSGDILIGVYSGTTNATINTLENTKVDLSGSDLILVSGGKLVLNNAEIVGDVSRRNDLAQVDPGAVVFNNVRREDDEALIIFGGATINYLKPATGIPSSDLDSATQSKITEIDDKADASDLVDQSAFESAFFVLPSGGSGTEIFRLAHGFDASVARPVGADFGDWEGFVDPTNKQGSDRVYLLQPSTPENFTAVAGDSSIVVSVDPLLDANAVEAPGGAELLVSYTPSGGSETIDAVLYSALSDVSSKKEATIVGLANGVEVDVKVAWRVPVVASSPSYDATQRTSVYSVVIADTPSASLPTISNISVTSSAQGEADVVFDLDQDATTIDVVIGNVTLDETDFTESIPVGGTWRYTLTSSATGINTGSQSYTIDASSASGAAPQQTGSVNIQAAASDIIGVYDFETAVPPSGAGHTYAGRGGEPVWTDTDGDTEVETVSPIAGNDSILLTSLDELIVDFGSTEPIITFRWMFYLNDVSGALTNILANKRDLLFVEYLRDDLVTYSSTLSVDFESTDPVNYQPRLVGVLARDLDITSNGNTGCNASLGVTVGVTTPLVGILEVDTTNGVGQVHISDGTTTVASGDVARSTMAAMDRIRIVPASWSLVLDQCVLMKTRPDAGQLTNLLDPSFDITTL